MTNNAVEDYLPSLGNASLELVTTEGAEDRNGEEHRAPLEMGHDGDDDGQPEKIRYRLNGPRSGSGDTDELPSLLAPSDLMQSGHGFQIREFGARPKTEWRTTCELCGVALTPPADDWVCELGSPSGGEEWGRCECNWCLLRGQWMRGEFRPKGGRPAKRCGTRECTRRAATERKRQQRARDKARKEAQLLQTS
ncbi:hypothetical protein [Rhodococcus gordoniae]|uniref:hypothetical protein n=1 Tax=Rhodococcus gordoniae TaxID=223392 RepID=UPI0020CC8725|nr:hypothetical protein [Rhodococcus gordoniae]UTT48919.1 hypothetical protein NMQ04_01500 [Rhodococcus gordoniae]